MYVQILTLHETFGEFCDRYPRLDIKVMEPEHDGVVGCWVDGPDQDMADLRYECGPPLHISHT